MRNQVRVRVVVGVGAWVARTTVVVAACPHVGDRILVAGSERIVICDRVTIGTRDVLVEQTYRFASAEDADEYFR